MQRPHSDLMLRSISSMFTSLLAVSYSVLLAWYIGTSIIFAAGLGTFWGAVMTALFDGFDGVGLASGEDIDRGGFFDRDCVKSVR